MKNISLFALALSLLLVPALHAQNFSGGDDFSNPATGNWSAGTTLNGGALTVSGGVLNFTDNGLSSASSSASLAWIPNAGSYTADWSVQVDFTLGGSVGTHPGEFASWLLILRNSAHPTTNYFTAKLWEVGDMQSGGPMVQASVTTGSNNQMSASPYIGGTTASLLVNYNAATTTLTAAFYSDGAALGYAFTDLGNFSIGSGWNMVTGDTFNLSIEADHSANAMPTNSVGLGAFTADNLILSGTPVAVPEPAALGLFAGLGALGFGLWRRRRAA